jgi:hypothetical protein
MEQQCAKPAQHLNRTLAAPNDEPNIAAARLLALASCLSFVKGNIISEEEIQSIERRIDDQRPHEINETAWGEFVWDLYQKISSGSFNPLVIANPEQTLSSMHPSVFELAKAAGWKQKLLLVRFGERVVGGMDEAYNTVHARLTKMLVEFTDQPPPDDIDALSALLVDLARPPNEGVGDRCNRLAAEFDYLWQHPGFRRYIFSPSDLDGLKVMCAMAGDPESYKDDCYRDQTRREVYMHHENELFGSLLTQTGESFRDTESYAHNDAYFQYQQLQDREGPFSDDSPGDEVEEQRVQHQSSHEQQPGNVDGSIPTSPALLDQQAPSASRPAVMSNDAVLSPETSRQRQAMLQREYASKFRVPNGDDLSFMDAGAE